VNDRTEDDNDGRFPDGLAVLTPFPITDEEIAGPRSGWPWVTAIIDSQVGPDEWGLVITDPEAVTDDDGTPYYPVVFRDASEIRLPDPSVEELREIFFREHGGTVDDVNGDIPDHLSEHGGTR
jgi:hypothetical protein